MAHNLARQKIALANELLNQLSNVSQKDIFGIQKLRKKVETEVTFLKKGLEKKDLKIEHVLCSNIGQLTEILKVVVSHSKVDAVLKKFTLPDGEKLTVDVVTDGGTSWHKIILRNPKALHITFMIGSRKGTRPLDQIGSTYIQAAHLYPILFKPPRVIFAFASGVSESIASSLINMGIQVEGEVIPDDSLDLPELANGDSSDSEDEILSQFIGGEICNLDILKKNKCIESDATRSSTDCDILNSCLFEEESSLGKEIDRNLLDDSINNSENLLSTHNHWNFSNSVNRTSEQNSLKTGDRCLETQGFTNTSLTCDKCACYKRVCCDLQTASFSNSAIVKETKGQVIATNAGSKRFESRYFSLPINLHRTKDLLERPNGSDVCYGNYNESSRRYNSNDCFGSPNTVEKSNLKDSCSPEGEVSVLPSPATYHLCIPLSSCDDLVNVDVSCMIAYTSATSNGDCNYIFKGDFLTEQAMWERRNPVKKVIDRYFEGCQLITCTEAADHFMFVANTVGGPGEIQRGIELLARCAIVDSVDFYKDDLPLSGRVKELSRLIFGTGQAYRAPTVTSNSGFIRAAEHKGLQLAALYHEPRALTEKKQHLATKITNI